MIAESLSEKESDQGIECTGCRNKADIIDVDWGEPWCWKCKTWFDQSPSSDPLVTNYKPLDTLSEEEVKQIVASSRGV